MFKLTETTINKKATLLVTADRLGELRSQVVNNMHSVSKYRKHDMKDCIAKIDLGWPEGREEALSMHKAIWDAVGSRIQTPDLRHDVAGFGVDIGRYLEGEPECMLEYIPQDSENQLIEIWVNVSYSGGISQSSIFNRGAAVLALIDGLERAGKTVVLNICDTGAERHAQMLLRVNVKEAGERLDIDKAAYMIAHSGFLRSFLFALYDVHPTTIRYGAFAMPVEYPKEALPQKAVYVGMMHYNQTQWHTPESCQAWVLSELVKQGVQIK